MAEWKRIFGNRRICIALLLIFLLNGFLFVREQVENDYGMDCELPAVEWVFSSDGDIELARESADSRAVLTRYLALTDEYKSIVPSEASILLETEKECLTELLDTDDSDETRTEYAAVNNLLVQAEYLSGYESYLLSIQENKEQLLSFSVFGDTDSFSGRNILKTAEDFEALDGSTLTIGADGAVGAASVSVASASDRGHAIADCQQWRRICNHSRISVAGYINWYLRLCPLQKNEGSKQSSIQEDGFRRQRKKIRLSRSNGK